MERCNRTFKDKISALLIERPTTCWGFHVLDVMEEINNQRCEALDGMTRSQALFGHLNQRSRRPNAEGVAEVLEFNT